MIRKIVFIFFLVVLIVPSKGFSEYKTDIVIAIGINYDNGTISSGKINLVQSNEKIIKKNEEGDYYLKLYSFKDRLLYETKFEFTLEILGAPPKEWFDKEGNQIYFPNATESRTGRLEKSSSVMFVPYFKNAKTIKIFKGEELKLEIDVSSFATCNENNICDNRETHELCPDECLCGNGKCDPGESYQTCSQDCPYIPEEGKSLSIWQRILLFITSLIARG